jgi:hypothetical protein
VRVRTSSATSTRSVDLAGEAGVGVLSSLAGVTAFLVLLLFAVQLSLNLYAGSAVAAVAYDGARQVATAGDDGAAVGEAEARGRAVLGRFESGGGRLAFRWDLSRGDAIVLTVEAERPRLLDRVPVPFQRVVRTAVVRREVPR